MSKWEFPFFFTYRSEQDSSKCEKIYQTWWVQFEKSFEASTTNRVDKT